MLQTKCLLLILLMFAITSMLFSQQEQMRIVILDLQPVGVSELTAKTVSDLLRTECVMGMEGYFITGI